MPLRLFEAARADGVNPSISGRSFLVKFVSLLRMMKNVLRLSSASRQRVLAVATSEVVEQEASRVRVLE